MMDTTNPKRNRSRRLIPVMFACVIALATRWWLVRGDPEHLFDLQKSYLMSVSHGHAILIESVPPNIRRVVSRAVTDQETHEIRQIVGNAYDLAVIDDTIYYTDLKYAKPNTLPRATLWRVPLSGAPAQALATNLLGSFTINDGTYVGYAVSGPTIYWIEAHYDRGDRGAEDRPPKEGGPHSDLMAMPLSGGPKLRLATGLSANTRLYHGDAGVYWTVSHPRPDPGNDLYYVHGTDTRPLVLHNYGGVGAPLELNGRIYWLKKGKDLDAILAMQKQLSGPKPPVRGLLVSARQDGSDLQVQSALDQATDMTTMDRFRNRIYVVKAVQDLTHGTTRSALWSLAAGDGAALQKVRDLPAGVKPPGYFDDDYYYFTLDQKRDNWWDFSSHGLYTRATPALYRYRLPD